MGTGVYGLGFRVQGSGFRVQGLGFRVCGPWTPGGLSLRLLVLAEEGVVEP